MRLQRFVVDFEPLDGGDDVLEPGGEGVGSVDKGVGPDGEAEGVAGGLAERVADFGAQAVRFLARGGDAEGHALDVGGTEVVHVLVGEPIAPAADEQPGAPIPGDEAGTGKGMAGEPEGDLALGAVEDVFDVQESMVLRFVDAN